MTAPPNRSLRSVVAVAGRRVDVADAPTVRFPYGNSETVRSALLRTLESAVPLLVVASAACGSDLLALDAASAMGIRTRIVLPFAPDVFRETSVIDRPNPDYWASLYRRLIAEAHERGDLILLDRDRNDQNAYVAANQEIIAEALRAANKRAPPAHLVAVIAWEGKPRGEDDATDDFRRAALQRGFAVKEISTLTPV
jgi:hypothetical protein